MNVEISGIIKGLGLEYLKNRGDTSTEG